MLQLTYENVVRKHTEAPKESISLGAFCFHCEAQTKRELKLSQHIIGLLARNRLKQVKPTYAISFLFIYFNIVISLKAQKVKPFQNQKKMFYRFF